MCNGPLRTDDKSVTFVNINLHIWAIYTKEMKKNLHSLYGNIYLLNRQIDVIQVNASFSNF